MSIGNAKKFIHLIQTDEKFRKDLYKVADIPGFYEFIKEKDLDFTDDEFEEAHNNLIVECQFEEQHDRLENAVNLVKLLFNK